MRTLARDFGGLAILIGACHATPSASPPPIVPPPEVVTVGDEAIAQPAPPRPAPTLTWTNRGYTHDPEDPDASVLRVTELSDTRPETLLHVRAIVAELPALYTCLLDAHGVQTVDANLHVRLVVDDGALTIEASPEVGGLDACLRVALSAVSLADERRVVSLGMYRPPWAHVLPVAPDAPNIVRGLGGCHFFQANECGPADDCPMDGFVVGLCPAAAPASIALFVRDEGAVRVATLFSRVGADGEPSYVAPLPFAMPVDTTEPMITIAYDTPPSVGSLTVAASQTLLAFVSGAGVVVLRKIDGDIRFAEVARGEEPLGWDDATGYVSVGRTRCPVSESRRGRLAIVCGDRIVLVRGGASVFVLDERGSLRDRKVLTPSPGLMPRLEGRVGDVTLRLDGRIYVH